MTMFRGFMWGMVRFMLSQFFGRDNYSRMSTVGPVFALYFTWRELPGASFTTILVRFRVHEASMRTVSRFGHPPN